jgi:hypothetical protein
LQDNNTVIPAQAGIHKHNVIVEDAVSAALFILQRQRLWIPGSAARPRDDSGRLVSPIPDLRFVRDDSFNLP